MLFRDSLQKNEEPLAQFYLYLKDKANLKHETPGLHNHYHHFIQM